MVKTLYNNTIAEETIRADIKRLTNQLWKLIPMRENNENWTEQISNLLVEISGLQFLFSSELNFLIILSKLQGLLEASTEFPVYRKIVFDIIHDINEVR